MKRLITLITLFLSAFSALAERYDIKYITNADGLSNSSVNTVFQDSRGRMWFGTWDGLDCWNGRFFKVYKPVLGDETSISSNIIRDILEDPDGNIWIATERGVDCLNPDTGRAIRFFTEFSGSVNVEKAFGICIYEGCVYASVQGIGVYRISGAHFALVREYSGHIDRFRVDAQGPLVLMQDGLVTRDGVNPDRDAAFEALNGVNDIVDGLVADSRGLRSGEEWIIKDIPVLSVFKGTQNIIWAGTDMHGVAIITPERKIFDYVGGIFEGCAVRCFSEDIRGNVYVGTKGAGMFMFDKYGTLVSRFGVAEGLLNNSVYVIAESGNKIWIGTDGRGLNYVNGKTFGSLELPEGVNVSSVYSIYCPDDSTLWIGTSGQGLYRLDLDGMKVVSWRHFGAEEIGSNVVYSVLGNGTDRIWIGTRGGGLHRYSLVDGTFTALHAGYDVTCLKLAGDGSLLAGTSMGLYRFYPDGRQEHYGDKEGLPNNTVHGILQDRKDDIWVSTNYGLSRVSDSGITSWYKSDGLQDNEFCDGAVYKSPRTGLMYFGGINGFNRLDSNSIEETDYFPSLVLDSFSLNNVAVPLPDYIQDGRLVLPHDKGAISFRFIPVDYINTERCELEYMLEGFDKEMVRLGSSETIVFSNLPVGSYTLKVRCSNSDKVWEDGGYELPVRIKPLWYESIWAYLIYLVVFGLVVALAIRQILYRQRARKRLAEEQQEKERMEEVHEAKLQFFTNIAHEFSNSLTLIYGPCEELQNKGRLTPEQKRYLGMIESNSDRMQSLIQQLILFRKAETGHLSVSYEPVELTELVRFESDYFLDRLEHGEIAFEVLSSPEEIVWNTDKDSMEKIVFNLISNAAKYTPSGEKITVSLKSSGEALEMAFTNTGIGISEDKMATIFDRFVVLDRFEKALSKGRTSNGIGLAMCKSLVEVLGGKISVKSDGATFTSFVVNLPWHEAAAPSSSSPLRVQEEIQPASQEVEPSAPTMKALDVLIVDDDKAIRTFIAGVLSDKFNIYEAGDGREALDVLSRHEPALIICDVVMPEMDGVELLRTLRKDSRLKHIPFILLSGKNAVEAQIEGLESGADAYMGKPFHPRHLLAVIDSILGREEVIREYNQSAWSAVQRLDGNLVKKSDKELLTNITDYILHNLESDSLSVDQIADNAAISKMQLYRKLKELTGMTPTEYIRHLRLEHAERLLTGTSRTVQEIMFECGFSSKTYFYREFSKKFGMTPREYRDSRDN